VGSAAGSGPDPGEEAVNAESLTLAFLVVLDELRPEDRAVFLLHEVFAYPYDEIESMVGRSAAACRQAVSRARQRIEASGAVHRRPRGAAEDELLSRVVDAMTTGDIDAVMRYMAPDVVVVSDAGSERRAARRPVIGRERSARLLVNLAKRVPEGAEITLQRFNGDPTIVLREDGVLHTTLTLEFGDDGALRRVYAMRNLDKLRHVPR
jgi:RNA polymerase sigma-70 factor (ECF subfamily)